MNSFLGLEVYYNIPLSLFTTFRIGGKAKILAIAHNKNELIKIISIAREKKLPFLIIGQGSNLLFSDEGFDGLVIINKSKEFKWKSKDLIEIESGITLEELFYYTWRRGLSGIEYLAGIPGTVGGAVRGNAGAYGHSIGELVREVKLLGQKGNINAIPASEVKFSYRNSTFKQGNFIGEVIVSVTLQLKPALDKIKLLKVREMDLQRRATSLPSLPSAGCIFKNPIICDTCKRQEIAIFLNVKEEELFKDNKMSVGKVIELLELKGKQIGDAMVSNLHGNFIVNCGKASASEIKELIFFIREEVKKQLDILLELEIEIFPPPKFNSL